MLPPYCTRKMEDGCQNHVTIDDRNSLRRFSGVCSCGISRFFAAASTSTRAFCLQRAGLPTTCADYSFDAIFNSASVIFNDFA
jgi:hypothetical protein